MVARYNRRWEQMDKSDIRLDALFKSYELFNRAERKSPRTVAWYDDKLRQYLRWLEENGCGNTLSEFTTDRVREFVLHLQDKNIKYERNPFTPTQPGKLSGHTIRGYVRTLKAFASWLYEDGYTDVN